MAGRSYDFKLVINTEAKSLNYGFIQADSSKIKLLLYYVVSGCCSKFLVLLNWNRSASESMTLLAIQYVFNTYRDTEPPVSQYGFARRYSFQVGIPNKILYSMKYLILLFR